MVLRKMPLQTFWMLHKNIDRISAERDMRTAMITIRSQSQEGVESMMKDLRNQMGQTIVIDEKKQAELDKHVKPDRDQLRRLKGLGDLTNHVYSG